MNSLAPIGLSAYSRLSHLKRTITALKNNKLSKQSHLFIFSDGPKEGDEVKVNEVRKYIRSIDGFKTIEIIQRKKNNRVKNNRNGIATLLDVYGKIIFIEEDIVTAPGFLKFMNEALRFYKNNESVFSITGYTPPIKADKFCDNDSFILPRFNAWGFGIWKNRYDSIKYFNNQELRKLLRNNWGGKYISNYLGEDALLMLQYEAEKIIDALDVKAMYQQVLSKKYTIYPKISLVKNIGNDGSGLHCIATEKYDTEFWHKTSFEFDKNFSINHGIAKAHRKFRKLNRKNKLIYLTKRYHIYSILRSIKSIILKNIPII